VVGKNIEISILVNSAGFNVYGPFTQTDAGDEMRMLQVNVMAVVALTKLFAHDMVERGVGRILNLASTASFTPAPFDSLYAASKAFVLSFTESLSEELKGTGVTVTALCPGPTDTEFAAKAGMSDTKIFRGRLLTAPQVVSIGYKALMRGKTIAVTGFGNKLQLFFIRLTPRAIVAKVAKNLLSRQEPGLEPNAHRA
jgi:short-subunit dehydrogenase